MGLFGIKFPWETPEGEGFIAPWTKSAQAKSGLWEAQPEAGTELATVAPAPGFSVTQAMAPYVAPPVVPRVPGAPPVANGQIMKVPEAGEETGGGGVVGMVASLGGVAAAALARLGVPAAIATGLVTGGTALLAARMKLPSETVAGEGFIAPWTQMVQDPATGQWMQEGAAPAAFAPGEGGAAMPAGMVFAWDNRARDGSTPATVRVFQDARGRYYSQSLRTGRIKTWRPKKHVVISSNPRVSSLRKLARLNKRVDKMLRPFQPKKKTYGQVPASLLSAAEKKLIGR